MKKLLFWLLLVLLPCAALADMEVHFLDAGHGVCTILLCDGEVMLVDGGPASSSDLVFARLRSLGVTDVKYAVATNPDADHVGGLPAAFHAARVQTLLLPVENHDGERFRVLTDKAAETGAAARAAGAGETLALGGAEVTVLRHAEEPTLSLLVRYGAHTFLLCGDEGSQAGSVPPADVLRVSYAGAGSLGEIEGAAGSAYAVVSCAELVKAPDRAYMEWLLRRDVLPLCTDYVGDVVFRSDGAALTFATETYYVANKNSKVFHRMTCSSVGKMKESNKRIVYSCEQAELLECRGCKNCSP